mgnify:CR=1 FL=1
MGGDYLDYNEIFDEGYECYKEYVTEYINSEKFWNLMHDVSMGELHVLTAIEKIKEKLNLNEE